MLRHLIHFDAALFVANYFPLTLAESEPSVGPVPETWLRLGSEHFLVHCAALHWAHQTGSQHAAPGASWTQQRVKHLYTEIITSYT